MSRLIVVSAGTERTLELEPGKAISVGREPSNDIALPEERQASRRHCEIRQAANGWEVVDLGATNKTRVNGAPVDRRALSSGDVVEVGKVTIRYEDAQEDERLQQAGRQGVCLLEWADGPRKGQKVMLAGPRTTLGRRDSNDIVLDDRMASGHHAEVVKDLNGYTIRDLGSTNGIMVNGNPTTESPLSHGARLRVGNSRFTFKDPSMKDIEVELSRLEDDDGWGMMGDIDLSRARGSKAGALSLLVVLALVGAGGWYIWNEGQKAGRGTSGGEVGEQIANGNFESEDMPWSWSEGGAVAVARVKSGGGHALQATVDASAKAPELVGYEEEFSASDGRTLKVTAKLKGGGDLVAVWRNEPDRAAGTTGIVRTVTVVSAKGGPSTRTLGFPTWATALRLVLRVQPGERVTLDDLSVRALPNAPSTGLCDCPGLPKGYVEADGSLSIVINNTVLVVGGQPVAWKGKERLAFRSDSPSTQIDLGARVEGVFVGADGEIPATVQWTSTEEGLSGKFECAGADRVGLALDLPRAHLGSVLNVLTAESARSVALTPGPVASDVRKTLAGNPESQVGRPATLIAVAPVGGTAALAVEDTDDAGLVRLVHELPGAKVEYAILTDFERQKQAAKEALAAAKALARTAPGPAHRRLLQVAQEYPFEASVVTESLQLAGALETTAKKDVDGLRESVQAFTILGSTAALDDMLKRARALRDAFLAGGEAPPEGAIETDVPGLVKRAEVLAGGHAVERALPDLDRFENVGRMLEETPGFEAMAALVYRSITQNYASLANADPEVAARLDALAKRTSELEQRPDVRDALPPR